MDRTQYGKVTLSDTYRPYDIILKRKPLPGYALLADLQTNLKKGNSLPASPIHHSTTPQYQQQHSPTTVTTVQTSVKSFTPSNEESNTRIIQIEQQQERPTYSNASDLTSQQQHQHIYQNDDHIHKQQQNGFQVCHSSPVSQVISVERSINSVGSSSAPHHNYENALSPKDKMYRHETREEVRTETRSSGPNPTPQRSTISNNLSELDSLLHDLNTTKHNSVLKETKVVNGNRPSVDSLLDELNSVGHRTETSEKRTTLQETRTTHSPSSTYPHKVSHVSASNATKELDDLMESLSDFKGVSQTSNIETKVYEGNTKQKTAQFKTEQRLSGRQDYDAPPRPPSPSEIDAFPVPPPRPPAPVVTYIPPDVSVPSVLPTPIVPSPTPATVSIIYTQPDQPQHRPPDSLVEDAFVRPESGGPVKRNDAEYRWVTDQMKHEIREVVERPSPPPQVEPKVKVNRINASSLQSQVDNAYAKPLPKRLSPPPPPKPQPKPAPPPNQLDSMLGSLTSHMTEQGINTSQKGCCCACDKPIVGQVITALGKTWHPEHFVCTICKEELGTKNFFERDGKPYCEPDYHNLFSPKCGYCSGPILDKCVTAMNNTWHPEHFFCAQCGNTFGEEGFHEKNGKPYCKDDYFNMFAPKCGGCNNPIMENYISALNSKWHPECFVCRDCKQSVASKAFYEIEGKPVCGECLGIEDDDDEEEEED